MYKENIKVETFYVVSLCECGGRINKDKDGIVYFTDPLQKDLACDKCGKIYRLFENDWPHYEYKETEHLLYKKEGV